MKLRAAPNYLRNLFRGNTGRYLGLNPAGAVLLVAMLALLAISTVSGAMQVTVRFFGVWWVEDTHAYSSNAIIVLAGLHVLGTILMSVLQRENLVRAMFTGRKQPAGSARPPQGAPSPERVPSRQQAEPDKARQRQRDEQDEGGPSVIPEFGSTSAREASNRSSQNQRLTAAPCGGTRPARHSAFAGWRACDVYNSTTT